MTTGSIRDIVLGLVKEEKRFPLLMLKNVCWVYSQGDCRGLIQCILAGNWVVPQEEQGTAKLR